ncbi:polysaccharide pyruvyl transferase family protein [Mycolicibacterium sp. P9-22]|uniref:polysaccharide pyruvyl transferase family protein n=1 Tax=Mycolicibacterium sp. P9-22 TaxID=2024613 RepID=UPI0011F024AE|nr:polysaccharide pyruvyl transferase family protein [Mycolicibacterium sp. P9-22]KAA0116905.1 polysaccharide pyruvyl transferase family protein [Mycolicibacterium sp. P9-22]
MRILVDHSGYALLNIGDVSMLQACIRRLLTRWPDADIEVITESPDRLAHYCPGTIPVTATLAGRRQLSKVPVRAQRAGEQLWKMASPLLSGSGLRHGPDTQPRLLPAIRRADVVVASGGGFVNDVFWWHGAGVLSVLAMAQRLGKPTAMFGQGFGPLTNPVLKQLLRRVAPHLEVIGLREGVASAPIVADNAVDASRVRVTGDDALLIATAAARLPTGDAIGVNVRIAAYSEVTEDAGRKVVDVVETASRARGVCTVALPVEYNRAASDLRITGDGGNPGGQYRTVETLIRRAAGCRAVVTGSYHAAVFGLAAGVPTVCVTNSAYYDGKFQGLAALFPGGCHIVKHGPNLTGDIAHALDCAWDTTESTRDALHTHALAQVASAEALYQQFGAAVDDSRSTARR